MSNRLRQLKARLDAVATVFKEVRAAQEARKWWAGSQQAGEHERAVETAREAAARRKMEEAARITG